MTVQYRLAGTLLTNRIEFPAPAAGGDGPSGFTSAADSVTIGASQVFIEDVDSSLTVTEWMTFTVDETDASPTRVWTGYITDITVSRGGKFFTGTGRVFSATLIDLNALLHQKRVRFIDNDGKRLAETDVARLTWVLGSRALSGLVYDEGLVSSAGPVNLIASDLRKNYADDIIATFYQVAGKNCFVYRDEASGNPALFYDYDTASVWPSTLGISNVASEVNNTTVFAPSQDAALEKDSSDRYGGVEYEWQGNPIYAQSATTIAAMGLTRDGSYSTDRVGHLATAQSEAVAWLNKHAGAQRVVNVTIRVDSSRVNNVYAGQELAVKLTHIDGFTAGVTTRVRTCTKRPVAPTVGSVKGAWDIDLRLWLPRDTASDAATTTPGAPVSTSGILWDHRSDTGDFPGPGKRGFSSVAWRIPWIRNGDPSGDPGGAHSHTPLTGLIEYQSWNGKFPAGSTGSPAVGPYTSGYTGSSGDNTNLGSGFRCLGGGTLDVSFTYDLNELPAGTATIEIRKNGTTVVATGSYVGPVLDATGTVSATGVAVAFGDVLACYAYTPSADGFSLGGTFSSSFSVTGNLATSGAVPLPAAGQPVAETPGGTINAANTAFTTAGSFIELPTNTLRVFHDGLDQTDHVSAYDGVAGTFSLDYAPSFGSVIKVFYTSS